jgi:amidase/6-aminohexanoate-cyclic-dimer hydrolase
MSAWLDLDRYDGLGLATLVRQREISAAELLDAVIARVEARNPAINAIIHRMDDKARQAIAASLPAGPFTGVPYLLKDLGALYAGTPTTGGSAFFRDAVADHDNEIVLRLKRAGLVIFGKTNTSEFGLSTSVEPRLFGPTRNPWNQAYSAGGSSGGAAAAVAAGMLPMAHATDGGGSIRIPASACGLFGLKPTRARTPAGPDVGESWNGAGIGHAVTRSVRDSAALLDATAGPDVGDPYWAPPPLGSFLAEVGADPGHLKIAVTTRAWNGSPVDPECAAAAIDAARLCESLGHHVAEASPAIDEAARNAATRVIIGAHTRATLELRGQALGREPQPEDVETSTWSMAEYGRQVTASDYAKAIRVLHQAGRVVGRFFGEYDVLITPTMCRPPHKLGVLAQSHNDPHAYLEAILGTIAFTSPFNSTGSPAMSVPLSWSRDGLPIGVQFAADFGDEATLFRLAAQLEKARPWAERRPGL